MKIPGSLNAARMPIARDGTRPWSHGLHDVGPVPGLCTLSPPTRATLSKTKTHSRAVVHAPVRRLRAEYVPAVRARAERRTAPARGVGVRRGLLHLRGVLLAPGRAGVSPGTHFHPVLGAGEMADFERVQGESRHLTRTRYEINGGGCADDVVQPCCCMPCVLTQEARELQLEEESFAQANGKPA